MMYTLAPKAGSLHPYDCSEGVYRVHMDATNPSCCPRKRTHEDGQAAADVALNRYPDPLAPRPLRRFASLYKVKRAAVYGRQRIG